MKASEIKVGEMYYGKISGKVVVVRVDNIRIVPVHAGYDYGGNSKKRDKTVYDVTNTVTNRTAVFKSAAKFRSKTPENNKMYTVRLTSGFTLVESMSLTELNRKYSFSIRQTETLTSMKKGDTVEFNVPEGSIEVIRK